MKNSKTKIILILLLGGLIVFLVPRFSILTAPVEEELLKELRNITGMEFTLQKVHLSLLPLYAKAVTIKGYDINRSVNIEVDNAKAYFGLTGLLNKEISINRLIIRGFKIKGQREALEPVIERVKTYLSEDKVKPMKVVVKAIDIESGSADISEGNRSLSIRGINVFAQPSGDFRARLFIGDLRIQTESIKDLGASIEAHIGVNENTISLSRLALSFYKSQIDLSGNIDKNELKGPFEIQAKILWEGLKRIFSLTNDGSGWVESGGKITIEGRKPLLEAVNLDLNVKGEFFLQTLMELLKVTEPLKGSLSLKGVVKGPLNDLEGQGKAHLKDGDIFDVAVDSLHCNVYYRDGAMRFKEGRALLYGGNADMEVMIALPVVNYFEVDVKVKDISSKGLFKLIKWDPGIAEGRVTGSLLSKGKTFNPHGSLVYHNERLGEDILNKIQHIDVAYKINEDLLSLGDIKIRSPNSQLLGSGVIDINKGLLNIKGSGKTSEVRELSSPYFTALSGTSNFSFLLTGSLQDPLIDMLYESSGGSFDTGKLGMQELLNSSNIPILVSQGRLLYRKEQLSVKELTIDTTLGSIKAWGNIHFKRALSLFDLRAPIYDMNFAVDRGNLKSLSLLFSGFPAMSGLIKGTFTLEGKPDSFSSVGSFRADKYGLYGYQLCDTLRSSISYKSGWFVFTNTAASLGNEEIKGRGSISLDKEFTLFAESNALSLKNIKGDITKPLGVLSFKNLNIHGNGKFDEPNIHGFGNVIITGPGSRYTVRGNVKLSSSDKKVLLHSQLLDNKMTIRGDISMMGNRPWSLDVDMKTARYDFLISGLLKDAPEDLVLNLNGNIKAWGDRDNLNGTAVFDKAHIYLYGNGFSNKGDIILKAKKNRIQLDNLVLFNDNANFRAGGEFAIGESYDLLFEGSSSLAPFKAFSSSLDSLKGDSRFVVSISGNWNEPRINGGIDISKGSIGLKNLYYSMTSLSAYVFFDEDRIVISNASGKIAGGDITLKGNIGLKRFALDKFFVEAKITNATVSPSRDFSVNFQGDLYARGDQNNQQIFGDVKINKGTYTERVDWKSWLIGAAKIEKARVESGRLDRIGLNIKIAGGNLQVDNNLSRSTFALDILLRGTLNNPIPIGKVETKEGTVFFRNNEFRIIKANLDFANPEQIKPYFNIVADTRVQNYNIRLTLEGFSDQFNLSLSSDPYLPETDIFALLTVGQTGKQLKGMEAGIGAGEAASFLTGKIQDILEERAKKITGFDRIQIDPAISKTSSTVSPRLTVSKRLMGDKLYVTYSASITSGEEQVWKLEYRLDPRTSLIGVRDERGGIGADVKFRFEFK